MAEETGVLTGAVPAKEGASPETPGKEASPAEKPWFDGFADPTVKEWVGKVGLKGPEAAAQKAWHLEKLLGADKAGRAVILPKDGDEKGMQELLARLGRPEKPEDYGIQVPEGADDSFLKEALPVLHKLGLTKTQAAGLAEWWATKADGTFAEVREKAAAGASELRREWGTKFDERVGIANRAVAHAGLSQEESAAVEQALGVVRAAQVMEKLGRLLIEDPSATTLQAGQASFRMSPEEAKAEIDGLKRDKEFIAKYTGGDREAQAKMGRLFKIAFPD